MKLRACNQGWTNLDYIVTIQKPLAVVQVYTWWTHISKGIHEMEKMRLTWIIIDKIWRDVDVVCCCDYIISAGGFVCWIYYNILGCFTAMKGLSMVVIAPVQLPWKIWINRPCALYLRRSVFSNVLDINDKIRLQNDIFVVCVAITYDLAELE